MTESQEALTLIWVQGRMHVQPQSRAMLNDFNVANLVEQLIWTGVMTVRTLAEVVYTLGAEVKLRAQTPRWKVSGRSLGAGRMRVGMQSRRGLGRTSSPTGSAAPENREGGFNGLRGDGAQGRTTNMSNGPVNSSERFVLDVCRRSFLYLWCHDDPKGKHGKELCYILVIGDPHVIIISVKEVLLKGSARIPPLIVGGGTKAVDASVKQIYGAERWLASASHVIRKDASPGLNLPVAGERKVHRAAESCACAC